MQKKRILSAVIAAALSATMAVPAFAAAPTFSDVPASHWAYMAIEKAAGAKMVGGIGNGNRGTASCHADPLLLPERH